MVKDCFINSKKTDAIYFGVGKSNCLTYIPEDIKLELNEEISNWTQPALTSNGTMDGNAFAVNQSSILNEDSYGFKAFDKQGAGTYWHSAKGFPQSIAWYNPKPLKITNVKVTNRSIDGSFPNAYQLQYSDDKNTWTTTNTGNGTSGFSASWNIAVSHTGFHKYWRLVVSSATGANSDYVAIGEIDITAQEKTSTLILKAGSKLYIPNGFESNGTTPKFDEFVIAKDYTFSTAWNDKRMLFIRHNSDTDRYIDAYPVGQCHSGSIPPTGSQWMFWYDTSSNILKRTSNSGTTWDNYYSFPICIYNSDNGGITSIDQIFNGFGYIGSTLYALPGVKGLIPNGLTEKGTYKSIERIIDKIFIYTYPSTSIWTRSKQPLFIAKTGEQFSGTSNDNYFIGTDKSIYNNKTYVTFYDTRENIMYHAHATAGSWEDYNCFFVGYVGMELGKITSLTPKAIQYQNTVVEVKRVYKGSQLIWGYDPSEVIFQSSTPGTYTVDIVTSGYYNVAVVGAGSGGAYVYSSKFSDGRASGGSGAGFVGIVYLTAGKHTIKVGAGGSGQAYESNGQSSATSTAGGQSAIDSIIVANGGGSAKAGIHGASQTAGSGGTLSYDSSKVQSYSLAKNGNAGTTIYNSNITGGASVYGGYGKGGNAGNSYTTSGSNGYVLISAV